MAKDPAVLFYTSDFLTGTYTMTNEQVGKYIRLLCLQHQKERLSEDEFNKILGKNCDVIREKFNKETIDGKVYFYQLRLREEAIKRKKYCESRRQNLESHMEGHMGTHMETHMEPHMENENENVNINKDKKKKIAENVSLTDQELAKLKERFGDDFTNKCIAKLDNYKGSRGKRYKSDYRAILNWVTDEVAKTNPTKSHNTDPLKGIK